MKMGGMLSGLKAPYPTPLLETLHTWGSLLPLTKDPTRVSPLLSLIVQALVAATTCDIAWTAPSPLTLGLRPPLPPSELIPKS